MRCVKTNKQGTHWAIERRGRTGSDYGDRVEKQDWREKEEKRKEERERATELQFERQRETTG